MPSNAPSSFREDIASPQGGTDSDLYGAVSPMISSESDASLPKMEAARVNALKEQVRKGLVGLEYMTGIKKNTGETFYDKHPVQAVATDVLSKSPVLGAGVAGLGLGVNYFRQKGNFDKTEPSTMSRGNNPGGDATHPSNLLNPGEGKNVRPDIEGLFGSFEGDAGRRYAVLDDLGKMNPADPGSFTAQHKDMVSRRNQTNDDFRGEMKALNEVMGIYGHDDAARKHIEGQARLLKEKHLADTTGHEAELKDLMSRARGADSHQALESYANFHQALTEAKNKGGFNRYLGEGSEGLLSHVAPGEGQAIADLAEKSKYNLTKANPHYSEEMLKQIVDKHYGGDAKRMAAFTKDTLPLLSDTSHQSSGIAKAFNKAKLPLAAGAATAVGGTGLYYLIKAIQNRAFSSNKHKEWKKTLLKSRGDFSEADKIN